MTAEQLQPFCSTDETRPNIAKPFSIGDWTYATDGRIIIRVPRLAEVPDLDPINRIDPDRLMVEHQAGPAWLPMPAVEPAPPPRPCTRCKGVPVPQCQACRGAGEVVYEFWHENSCYRRDEDCPVCQGVTSCPRCDGTLTEPEQFDASPVEIGGILIGAPFARLLASLPGCELAPRGEYDPCRFRFDGGEGLVMPLRRSRRYQP